MRKLLVLFVFAFSIQAHGQLSNSVFRKGDVMPKTKYGFTVEALQFLKNNEYFHPIHPGETFFGFQAKMLFHYKLAENARISTGGVFQQNFGDAKFLSKALPILSFDLTKNHWTFRLGNVKPHIYHNLIEPMLNYENILTQPVEYGLQASRVSEAHFYDLWLHWQKRADAKTGTQEQIVFGQSLDYPIFRTKSISLFNPIQTIVYHQGGQALNISTHLRTTLNGAIGLKLVLGDSGRWIAESYALASVDNSPTLSQPYKNGWASFSALRYRKKYHEISLNWWYAREFTSAIGGQVFQNVNLANPYLNKNSRRIAMLRYVYSRPIIGDKIWMDLRLEPYYDLDNKATEFSQGLYFRYVEKIDVRLPRWMGL